MNSGADGFESWARCEISARLPTGLPPVEWRRQIQAITNDMDVNLELQGEAIPAYRADKNSPLVRAFLAAIRAHQGQPGFVLKTGTADLNIVAPVWKCPAIAYGPGDSSLDHTPQEHLDLDEYDRAVAVLETSIKFLTTIP